PAIAAPRLPPAPAPGASSRWPPVALGSDRVPPPREFGEEAAAILIARRRVEAQLASDCRDVGLDGLLCVSQPLHNDCTAALTRGLLVSSEPPAEALSWCARMCPKSAA